MRLYSYWRSSSAYRVRIALNLKGLDYETIPVHLVRDGGEQHSESFRRVNPQQLVPALEWQNTVIMQSCAIIEFLEDRWPAPPLLPADAGARARVRSLAQLVACEIQPLNNLRVLIELRQRFGADEEQVRHWYQHWLGLGFSALEAELRRTAASADFCAGNTPGMADAFLIPQVYNARRYDFDLTAYPEIERIDANCANHPAFIAAAPENQPDAPEIK